MLTAFAGAAAASAAEHAMWLGHATANDAQDAVARLFAERVEIRSGGRIDALVFNGGQLGNNKKMNDDVRWGVQHAIVQPTSFASTYLPLMQVLDLPLLFPDEAVQNAVMNGPAADPLRTAAREVDLEIVAFYPAGVMHFVSSFPIDAAADLAGRKIRVLPAPVYIERIEAYGAIGVPMPIAELFTAFQQGAVHAAEFPPELIRRAGFHRVAPYVTYTGNLYVTAMIAVHRGWFERLAPLLQEAVYEAGRDTAQAAPGIRAQFDTRALEALRGEAAYSRLPPAERERLAEADRSVWTSVRRDPRMNDLLERLLHAVAELR